MRKAVRGRHCPLQNKKLSLCIVAWFLWEHRGQRDGQETVRLKWSNVVVKEKKEKEKEQ